MPIIIKRIIKYIYFNNRYKGHDTWFKGHDTWFKDLDKIELTYIKS